MATPHLSRTLGIALLCASALTAEEAVQPLIKPAIIPLQEQPAGGIPKLEAPTTPPPDGAPTATPLTNTPATTPPATDPSLQPIIPTDPNSNLVIDQALADAQNVATPDPNLDPNTDLDADPDTDPQDQDTNQGNFAAGLDSALAMTGSYFPGSSGLSNLSVGMLDGFDSAYIQNTGQFYDIRDGLGMGVSLTSTYDSNTARGFTTAPGASSDDFFMTLGASVNYLSRASTWTYGGRYTGGYSQYFNQSELSGYFQNAGASLNYTGGPLTATLNLGLDFGSGANRYYNGNVNEIRYSYGINARYKLSTKTNLTANASQNSTRASGDFDRDTDSLDLGASALWKYSPLLEFGPGIRYTDRSGDGTLSRTSIGPTVTANYNLTRKVSLSSRIGIDFPEYDTGEKPDPTLYTSIGISYKPSQLWSMNLTLVRDTRASFNSANEFEEVTSMRLGVNRKIRSAIWNIGLALENGATEYLQKPTTPRPDREYLTVDTGIGMPVFQNTCYGNIFLRYNDQQVSPQETWDAVQVGMTLSRNF